MITKKIIFKKGTTGTMDDLDKLLNLLPIGEENKFTTDCEVIVKHQKGSLIEDKKK